MAITARICPVCGNDPSECNWEAHYVESRAVDYDGPEPREDDHDCEPGCLCMNPNAPNSRYADELYMRLSEAPESVNLFELQQVRRLEENGQWMDGAYAANTVYRLLDRLGRDTSGHIGF